MKIVSLNNTEAAATGFTHIVNIRAANGDVASDDEVNNIIPIIPGFWIKDCAIDVRTAWNTLTTPALSMGVAATGTADTSLLASIDLSTTGLYSGASLGLVINDADQFVTIHQEGTGNDATAGEANIFFRLVDLRLGRVTFAN